MRSVTLNSCFAGLLAVGISTNVQAGMISVSRVITNTTSSTQSYEVQEILGVGIPAATASMRGSLSIAVSDFNRNGARLESVAGKLYTAWINGEIVRALPVFDPATGFLLTAPSLGIGTHQSEFDWMPVSLSSPVINTIQLRLNFQLSPGDQVAIAGVFETSNIPAPCSIFPMLLMFKHRRRNFTH